VKVLEKEKEEEIKLEVASQSLSKHHPSGEQRRTRPNIQHPSPPTLCGSHCPGNYPRVPR